MPKSVASKPTRSDGGPARPSAAKVVVCWVIMLLVVILVAGCALGWWDSLVYGDVRRGESGVPEEWSTNPYNPFL